MDNLTNLIEQHPLLKDISDVHLAELAECANYQTFNAGHLIFREGAEADKCFLIQEGTVSLEIFNLERGNILVQTLGPGDVLGWSWLVSPYKWRFDAKALKTVKAIVLDGTLLRKKCSEDPSFGYELLKKFVLVLEQRLHATRLQLLEVYGMQK